MTLDQILISALLVIALVLFVLGRPRYDLVALGTLLDHGRLGSRAVERLLEQLV